MRISIILLAAGKGQRFQQSTINSVGTTAIKQLAQLNGKALIVHSIEQLHPLLTQQKVSNLYVTLGANKNVIKAVLPRKTSVIASQQWSKGMGHSLAESVHSIKAQSSHVLVALADQALIPTEHYQALVESSKKNPTKIIATSCENNLMAPAIFPEKYFAQLMKLQGDKGAGKLIKQYAAQVQTVVCNTAKFDIDTIAELEQISQMLKQPTFDEETPSHCQNLESV
jgi:molybdenum cofactor cytidylyltransferase